MQGMGITSVRTCGYSPLVEKCGLSAQKIKINPDHLVRIAPDPLLPLSVRGVALPAGYTNNLGINSLGDLDACPDLAEGGFNPDLIPIPEIQATGCLAID